MRQVRMAPCALGSRRGGVRVKRTVRGLGCRPPSSTPNAFAPNPLPGCGTAGGLPYPIPLTTSCPYPIQCTALLASSPRQVWYCGRRRAVRYKMEMAREAGGGMGPAYSLRFMEDKGKEPKVGGWGAGGEAEGAGSHRIGRQGRAHVFTGWRGRVL